MGRVVRSANRETVLKYNDTMKILQSFQQEVQEFILQFFINQGGNGFYGPHSIMQSAMQSSFSKLNSPPLDFNNLVTFAFAASSRSQSMLQPREHSPSVLSYFSGENRQNSIYLLLATGTNRIQRILCFWLSSD